MIRGIRVFLAPGCTGTLWVFSRPAGDQYVEAEMPGSGVMEPSVLSDFSAISDPAYGTNGPYGTVVPAETPAVIAQIVNQQLIFWETNFNKTLGQYAQFKISDLAANTFADDVNYGNYFGADVSTKLQGIEGLLHAKYDASSFSSPFSLVAGDNNFTIPNSGGIALNPIGAYVKILTRGANLAQATAVQHLASDTADYGWIANIYALGGALSGDVAYGGKQSLFYSHQLVKLEQL